MPDKSCECEPLVPTADADLFASGILLFCANACGLTTSIAINARNTRVSFMAVPLLFFPVLFRRCRRHIAARRLPDSPCVILFFIYNAKIFADLPSRLKLKTPGRTHPSFCVSLGIIHDDAQFHRVMVDAPVTLRQMHLLAARISVRVDPRFIVETNCLDN